MEDRECPYLIKGDSSRQEINGGFCSVDIRDRTPKKGCCDQKDYRECEFYKVQIRVESERMGSGSD